MAEPSAWTYVDDRRTHEVRATIEKGRTTELVVREQAFGGSPPDEIYTERHTLVDPWDKKLRLMALETKLSRLGNYYKFDGTGGWTPVRVAQATNAKIDLAPLDTQVGSDALEFHHFNGEDRHAVSLVAVHNDTDRGRRTLLVRLDYEFPDTDGGNLEVIHSKLSPILYRSALASLHLELAERRFRKAQRDERKIADPRAWAAMRAAIDAILARLVKDAGSKVDGLVDGMGRPLDLTQVVAVNAAAKASRNAANKGREYDVDYEVDMAASAVEGKAPEVTIEEIPNDIFGALNEPKLLALHARFMTPDKEKELFAKGERAIHLAMRDMRNAVRPDEQHFISTLEASLLLRYALKNRISVDPNVIKRVQHARAYL